MNASLPGYTRLSLHFGNTSNCLQVLNNVNNILEANNLPRYFPISKDKNNANLNRVYQNIKYNLPSFGMYNTGIINNREYAQSEIYAKQFKTNDTMDKGRIKTLINFMYPDLNDREVFYLAEKSEFGKKDLLELKDLLIEREERTKIAKEKGIELRDEFLLEKIDKSKNKGKTINNLYKSYLETEEITGKSDLVTFKKLLDKNNVKNEYIDEFLKQNKKEEAEKKLEKIDELDFNQLIELANDGINISKDIFSKKFIEEEELDILYSQKKQGNTPPVLNDNIFKTIFRNGDFRTKMLLLFRTVEARFANEPKIDDEKLKIEYQNKKQEDQEKLEEIVMEEVNDSNELKQHGDKFVAIISNASTLIDITNNEPDNKKEQGILVQKLWENYSNCILEESNTEEISRRRQAKI